MQQNPFHIRRLHLYTDRPFTHHGSDLRRAVTGAFPDRAVLHNHLGESFDYRSPRVRYTVIDHRPQIISFDDGLQVLEEIYREGLTLRVGRESYRISGAELEDEIACLGTIDDLMKYKSTTPWLALNKENHQKYLDESGEEYRQVLFGRILNGNYLSLCKGVGISIMEKLMTRVITYRALSLSHQGTRLIGFRVEYVSNMILPEGIGLGKLVSKGFGLMKKT